ncbi:site-specific integrase [Paenibacillus oryzisoli]|uniref:Integrase n=1 Tax=Paenibacillus oryzisoli TaxID=1850517 RepID=A0A198A7L7_9BACL|nr:site-specific integrase [Paenibacillus oryzisoli]OAS17469.1 integrase [Paenibacillus oryzisoli]
MNFVQPIRDEDKLVDIQRYLMATNERNYILFVLGTYTGLRISDILRLQVGMVKGSQISIREKKTGKKRLIPINPDLKMDLKKYIVGRPDDEYLFKSKSKNAPITRDAAYKMLNTVARKFELSEIGTHTLRKTFGYHFYSKTKDIALLMEIFNHSHPSITLRYIGINQETIDNSMNEFRYRNWR